MSDELLRRSARERTTFFEEHRLQLQQQAESGQKPEALLVACSDSRVVPEQLLGAAPGELFMLRTVANIVPPYWQTEIAVAAVLEYAVLALAIPRIVVCGHTDCGGILALDQGVDLGQAPALSRWVELTRPTVAAVDSSTPKLEGDERHQAIVEANVLAQLDNLASYPYIREAIQAERLQLHGWVYRLAERSIGYYDQGLDRFVPA